MKQKGFAVLPLIIILSLVVIGGVLFVNKGSKETLPSNDYGHDGGNDSGGNSFNKNPYLGVPCKSNPKIQFTNDFTEVDKIRSVEPTIITPGNSRHRVWLNISSGKVAVYAPVDSELVGGVYKDARGAIDFDLHFQVSCEIWYLINHVTEPVDKIKNAFPKTPQ